MSAFDENEAAADRAYDDAMERAQAQEITVMKKATPVDNRAAQVLNNFEGKLANREALAKLDVETFARAIQSRIDQEIPHTMARAMMDHAGHISSAATLEVVVGIARTLHTLRAKLDEERSNWSGEGELLDKIKTTIDDAVLTGGQRMQEMERVGIAREIEQSRLNTWIMLQAALRNSEFFVDRMNDRRPEDFLVR